MNCHITLIIVAALLILIEVTIDRFFKKGFYNGCDTLKNLFLGMTAVFSRTSMLAIKISSFFILYQYAVVHFELTWEVYVIGFFIYDLFNYFFHRLDHVSRFFWAAHVNHHSSEEFNFSVALRNPMMNGFYEFIFWSPLVLLGFNPLLILLYEVFASYYSTLLHTKLIKNYGVLDYLFNSPSHHRVHHACNEMYLDKNFGQVLIIWDRMFGTFQKEVIDAEFGITKPVRTNNPFKLIFHEYCEIIKDVKSTKSIKRKLFYVFGPPGQVERVKMNIEF